MFYNVIDPAKSFSNAYFSIQKGSAAIERINYILETPSEKIPANNILKQPFTHSISFEQVHFSYDDDSAVLENIDFTIKRTKTAIVGPSGAGKSTLLSLFCVFMILHTDKFV